MSEKKNIDRLFQEKFKDFDVAPPEGIWQNIEAELLKEKKEKKVIPLWFRLSGVAAILLVGMLLTMPLFNNGFETNNNPIVIDKDGNQGKGQLKRISPVSKPVQENEVVTDADSRPDNAAGTAVASQNGNEGGTVSGDKNNTDNRINTTPSSRFNNKNNAVASGAGNRDADNGSKTGKNLTNRKPATATPARYTTGNDNAVAYDRANKKSGTGRDNVAEKENTGTPAQKQNAVAVNGSGNRTAAQRTNAQANGNTRADGLNKNTAIPGNTPQGIAVNGKDGQAGTVNATGVNGNLPEGAIQKDMPVTFDNDAVVIAPAVTDTTKVAPENELEKLLQDKLNGKDKEEEKAVAEANKNKWNIKPQLAPVFYNSLSEGSPIDEQFAGNSKSYDNDLSYGVGVNYALSDRISIRTGVNTVNLSYSTNGIQFYAALNEQTPNVAARGTVANIVVQNGGSNPNNEFVDELGAQKFNGSLVQKMSYIEVPLEMSYKVLNTRFGIDIIGGVSTLFLNENNVSVLSSQGYRTEVGEAQNLNSVHFSTNIGLGFKYRFWKAFEANFEPMFKYQVNTFSSDAGNFKPYFIGLYSGISFSF